MADRVLFMGWNRPVVGREQQAMQLFQKAMEFHKKLQADGQIESFDAVLLAAHGGDLNGFVMLKGNAEKLAEVQKNDEFLDMQTECRYCLEGYGVITGYINEGLKSMFARWSKLIGS